MEDIEVDEYRPVTILDVLGVDLCTRAILQHVPVAQLVRSERVSRRWQRAVVDYLRTCRTLSYVGFRCESFERFHFGYRPVLIKTFHRTISINNLHSLPLVCKTLDKWGLYIMTVIINPREDIHFDTIQSECTNLEHFDTIVSKCTNLEHFEMIGFKDEERYVANLTKVLNFKHLKQILFQNIVRFSSRKPSDLILGELFQDIHCENITISYNKDLTGSFLQSLKSGLKSLRLTGCSSLSVSGLLTGIDTMRNLTRLELEGFTASAISDVHLLLTEMPQLEELTLNFEYRYYFPATRLSDECIQAFSRLDNLKRLTMDDVHCGRVTDAFLEALARGCRKLEYLKILRSTESVTARGVTALCRRSPSARTTLHFSPDNLSFKYIYDIPLYKELAALGCVELTQEWFKAACLDPRGRELRLNPSLGSRAEEQEELKLIIY